LDVLLILAVQLPGLDPAAVLLHEGQVALELLLLPAVEVQPELVPSNVLPELEHLGIDAGDYEKMGRVLVLPTLHRLEEPLKPAREHICLGDGAA
jgi:hypothetical protein